MQWLAAALVATVLAFGVVADRAMARQARSLREAAKSEAHDTAAMAALSVRATLARTELAITALRPIEGVSVARAPARDAAAPRATASPPYARRSPEELLDLVANSRSFTPQGLPEAVVAALALAAEEPRRRAAERLLSGALPVDADDIPFLAAQLGVTSDPRITSLQAQLRAAPEPADLPDAPDFQRSLTPDGSIRAWSVVGNEVVGYEIPVATLLLASAVSDRAHAMPIGNQHPAGAQIRSAPVPDVPGLQIAVAARRENQWPLRAMRIALWAAVLAATAALVATLRAVRREQQGLARERAFLENVTHELRTPLAALRLLGETLALRRGDPQEYGDRIANESQRLESLVEGVLASTRVEKTPSISRVLPLDLVQSALSLVADRATRRGMTLDGPSVPGSSREALWDADAVRQAILNLLDNAIRYGKTGGHVAVAIDDLDDRVEISVSDDGPGIAPNDRARIFQRFGRGRSASPGTGLGLFLVERVAQAHGGKVRLESARELGSRFTLELPRHPPSQLLETSGEGVPA